MSIRAAQRARPDSARLFRLEPELNQGDPAVHEYEPRLLRVVGRFSEDAERLREVEGPAPNTLDAGEKLRLRRADADAVRGLVERRGRVDPAGRAERAVRAEEGDGEVAV